MNWQKKDWIPVVVVSVIHFLISAAYRLFFYEYDTESEQFFEFPVARKGSLLSLRFEQTMSMVISGILGAALIVAIWYVLIRSIKEKRKGVWIVIVCSVILTFMLFPLCFLYQYDTFELYYEAVRNRPDYWQNVYTTCIYNACLLVFPQAFMITMIQINAFLGVLYYLSIRFRNIFSEKAKYVPWLFLLVPGALEVACSSYRNCINTIMCMAFLSVLFCDMIQNKTRTGKELFLMCVCSSFLAVFRSEQVLFLIVLTAALYFVYKCRFAHTMMYLGFMLVLCVALLVPQKLGEHKYYEKDYAMVNQMETIGIMLTEKNINLSYEGAGEDIQRFEAIVPMETVKKTGLNGYWGQLYQANGSTRQTFADKEQQEQFLRAVNNIILHNPSLFLKARVQLFMEACGIKSYRTKESTEETNEVNEYYYTGVLLGKSQMYEDLLFPDIIWNEGNDTNRGRIMNAYGIAGYYLGIYGGVLAMRLTVFLLFALLGHTLKKEQIIDDDKKKFMMLTTLALYAQLAGIFLLGPEGKTAYYYPVFFGMLTGVVSLLVFYVYAKAKNSHEDDAGNGNI